MLNDAMSFLQDIGALQAITTVIMVTVGLYIFKMFFGQK